MRITDPVCGMAFDAKNAVAQAGLDGRTYYFCSEGCKRRFVANPDRYVEPPEAS